MAMFLKREAALVYSSSYAVNLGIFGKLLGKDDAILSDKSNHASLIDGIRYVCPDNFVLYLSIYILE